MEHDGTRVRECYVRCVVLWGCLFRLAVTEMTWVSWCHKSSHVSTKKTQQCPARSCPLRWSTAFGWKCLVLISIVWFCLFAQSWKARVEICWRYVEDKGVKHRMGKAKASSSHSLQLHLHMHIYIHNYNLYNYYLYNIYI